MADADQSESPALVEVGESNTTTGGQGTVKDEQWRAMKSLIDTIYEYRQIDGHDPSKVFHRKPNKRALPDYYDVIKEPVALSTLKAKVNGREYKNFAEFVRDCALIPHNAQTYNRPEAGAYQDAIVIRDLMEKEFKKLADQNIITADEASLPDLGEIPPASPLRIVEEEEEEDDDDEDDDDDDDIDDSEDEGGKRKRKRGPRSVAAITKREGGSKEDVGQKDDPRKKRGRPPRVDTPMESRIKAVLKGIRKHKNDMGQIMIHQFEKLPDKTTMPEYYQEIKEPIAIEMIKRKQKRKKYQSVDHFMRDINTMFNNAKTYNTDESQIYKEASFLQNEAHKLADAEKRKPDTDYVMEEGRLPLPNGILHNGELWKVGDWIHIQNPNDVTKPIVAQIYRTWQDSEGQKWVNACWYYRPEQTVHQFEKHFYPSEVVKTGQYRDHQVNEIVDRCFVMFCTRYSRGRPRGFPTDKEVYVCDSRYNEEKHKLNKIKTWASCLPDEIRDKDYEMDLFDGLKKVKKVSSPILHTLKEDAKETDELPKPQWGAENAPPVIGAVYKGPRDENQSPPPEPTPSPPPQPPPPPPPPRQVSSAASRESPNYGRSSEMDTVYRGAARPSVSNPSPSHGAQSSYTPAPLPQHHQNSASPAPVSQPQYGHQSTTNYSQVPHSSISSSQHSSHLDHYSTPQSRYSQSPAVHRSATIPGVSSGQRPYEVFHLSDSANASIPEDIREQFQRDDQGHVLFFTAPPLDVLPPVKEGSALGHTAHYLAEKLRRNITLKEQRKTSGLPEEPEKDVEPPRKKPKLFTDPAVLSKVPELRDKALRIWIEQMEQGTETICKNLYGEHWEEGMKYEQERLAKGREEARAKNEVLAERDRKKKESRKVQLLRPTLFLDDFDPRY